MGTFTGFKFGQVQGEKIDYIFVTHGVGGGRRGDRPYGPRRALPVRPFPRDGNAGALGSDRSMSLVKMRSPMRAALWQCLALLVLVVLAAPPVGRAQAPTAAAPAAAPAGAELVRATYTKYEYLVPMRDGVRLFTAVYVPKDASRTYPFLLTRTPYSVAPYGVDRYPNVARPSEPLQKEGFIFVHQDARGRYMSEGEFQQVRPFNPGKGPKDIDESTDTYDTIEWLLKHVPNHNGRVGMIGIS